MPDRFSPERGIAERSLNRAACERHECRQVREDAGIIVVKRARSEERLKKSHPYDQCVRVVSESNEIGVGMTFERIFV